MPVPVDIVPIPGSGPEDVLVGEDGAVYAGTQDGAVFRIEPGTTRIRRIGHTGGRPLGLEFLPDRRLLVADAHRGLLALDPDTGTIDVLVATFAGQPLRFCNNAAVADNGDIWFSDSSRHYSIDQWKADLSEDTRSGRLLLRRSNGEVEVILDGLAFANGVALAPDESFVAVAQTTTRDIVRYWLAGPRKGQLDYLCQDLPGYPDNIALGSDGLIWVAIASPTTAVLGLLHLLPPRLRWWATRIPELLQPQPQRTVRVMAFDGQGQVCHDIVGQADNFYMVTGVREHQGAVWLGSLEGAAVGRIMLSTVHRDT